jgi:hypothetical protein
MLNVHRLPMAAALVVLALPTVAPAAISPDSIAIFEARVEANKKDGGAWLRLGQLFYDEGLADTTEQTFRLLDRSQDSYHEAIKRTKSARSYYGLGLVYKHRCRDKHQSVYCLRVEANLKSAIKRDKTFAPAYLALADWHRDGGIEDQMIELLEAYGELRPDDSDGRYGLSLTYNERFDYDRVYKLAHEGRKDFPEEVR